MVGYATCLGEFGAVITFAANIPGQTQTLPLAIYTALQVPGGEATAANCRSSRYCSRWSGCCCRNGSASG